VAATDSSLERADRQTAWVCGDELVDDLGHNASEADVRYLLAVVGNCLAMRPSNLRRRVVASFSRGREGEGKRWT
jgi:hypothetical protein